MSYLFFPSCKAKAAYKGSSALLEKYIYDTYRNKPVGCCKAVNSKLTVHDTAIILCLNCARVIEKQAQYKGIEFVWEIIDKDEDFVFPDYQGCKMTLQDCHISKDRDSLRKTVRSLMKKMNITIVEMESNKEYQYCPSYNLVGFHGQKRLTKEQQHIYFNKRYNSVPTDIIVSYCKYCNDGVTMSQKTGKHLLELLFPVL